MIARDGAYLRVQVPMVLDNARALLAQGVAELQAEPVVFDLAAVTEADSSALAVMLGWLRAAGTLRSTVTFAAIPPGVLSLAKLYGVVDLLPQA